MIRFNGQPFFGLSAALQGLSMLTSEAGTLTDKRPSDLDQARRALAAAAITIKELGFNLSVMHIDRIRAALDQSELTYSTLGAMIRELQDRLTDEMSSRVFLLVASEKTFYYENKHLFGVEVAQRLPSATRDIEGAGKCLAVGQFTASVFHILRVVELGLRAFGSSLGILAKIKMAQPSWGGVLRETWNEIQAKNKSGDLTWTHEKKSFFENVQSDLQVIKTAWRNATMHVDSIYDEERAEDIFNAVRSWMRHLAKHMDESGTFIP